MVNHNPSHSRTDLHMPPVRLYGARSCHKSRFYQDALNDRQVSVVFRDVEEDQDAAGELRLIFGNDPEGHTKFPTFLINGKRIRNPRLRDLDRALAHEGLYDPGVVHEPQAQRFVKFMRPTDAFVSYSESGGMITLGHIEVPIEQRGSGLGAKLALEVFEMIKDHDKPARITCPFMRKVAQSVPEWAAFFNVKQI